MSGTALHIPLEMRFKGARLYLQGGDIYQAMVTAFSEATGLVEYSGDLIFHRFATNQCNLIAVQNADPLEMPADRVCDGSFLTSQGEWRLWLEETERLVTESYPFDEAAVCAAATIDGNSIIAGGATGCLPVEVAVALTKCLHNHLFPVDGQRWIFTKFEFNRLFQKEDVNRIRIKLLMNLHNRITKSELRMGDDLVGHIYFSAVKK